MSVAAFVRALAATPAMENVFNPWATRCQYDHDAEAPAIRRRHLQAYLQQRRRKARLLLLGEAPGYQGCKHSGIAMTSERILLGGHASATPDDVFRGGKARTSAVTSPKAGARGAAEPTATIVWGVLRTLGVDPYTVVFWNAFAFHPHDPGQPLTNRAPRAHELAAARPLLLQFIKLYPGATVAAMGDVAADALGALCTLKVRHPSYGGAPEFRQQMATFYAEPTQA